MEEFPITREVCRIVENTHLVRGPHFELVYRSLPHLHATHPNVRQQLSNIVPSGPPFLPCIERDLSECSLARCVLLGNAENCVWNVIFACKVGVEPNAWELMLGPVKQDFSHRDPQFLQALWGENFYFPEIRHRIVLFTVKTAAILTESRRGIEGSMGLW